MGYRETSTGRSKPVLHLDADTFDIDFFGMDDGRSGDPDAAMRFIFQLGSGLMIYLYVIQAGGRATPAHFFHTLWLKDCAVAEVEVEDRGPPKQVRLARTALPLNYTSVRLGGVDNGANGLFTIDAQFFTAEGTALTMEFELDGGAKLAWSRAEHWTFSATADSALAPLAAGVWPEFGPPGED